MTILKSILHNVGVLIVGMGFGLLGTLALTALNLIAVDIMIRREERQLAATFGEEWQRYQGHARRWL